MRPRHAPNDCIHQNRFAIRLAIVAVFAAASMEVHGQPPEYRTSPGPHKIEAVETLVLHDGARNKDLKVRVTYPAEPGRYPLIVWSHGAFGTKDNYQPIVTHWTSYGYVCIQANHSDSLAEGGREVGFTDSANRPKDVSFILDSIKTIEERIPGVGGKIDVTRLGVGGHSYGAHTAQMVAGVKRFTPDGSRSVSFRDPRVKAAIVLSGQGRGEGVTEKSWAEVSIPMLVVTGTNDNSGRTGKGYAWRMEPYEYSPPGDKFLMIVDGAHHGFGGMTGARIPGPGAGPLNEDHVKIVKAATLAFWDAYLNDSAKAKAFLASGAMVESSGEKLEWRAK